MLFLVTLVLAVISQAVGDGYAMLLATVVFGPVLLFTVLIHELGRCLAARKVSPYHWSLLTHAKPISAVLTSKGLPSDWSRGAWHSAMASWRAGVHRVGLQQKSWLYDSLAPAKYFNMLYSH